MSTAYNLARLLPGKRIVVFEGARCGYGASGRNGGFADAGEPGLAHVYETRGPEAARAYYDATRLGLEQIRTFVDEYGVAPKAYLLARRLAGTRRDLRRGVGGSVGDVARDWGFWHMGQLAADYRRHFGELPSDTRARAVRRLR
jgi:glycine/D-amino acid oxidase-like deaminating enzyme